MEETREAGILRCILQSIRDGTSKNDLCYGCPVMDVEPVDRKSCAIYCLEWLKEQGILIDSKDKDDPLSEVEH